MGDDGGPAPVEPEEAVHQSTVQRAMSIVPVSETPVWYAGYVQASPARIAPRGGH
jgi:hypothetical protein